MLIPLITGIIRYKKLDLQQSFFFLFIVASVMFESISIITALNGIENIWLFKLFVIFEFFFFTWFLFRFHTQKRFITHFNLFLTSLSIVLIIIPIFTNVNDYYDSIIFMVIFSGFIIQALIVLLGLFENYNYSPLNNSIFWIFSGRLMYFLITFYVFVFPLSEIDEVNNESFRVTFFILNTIGNIICNVLYSSSFLCKQKLN
jgi:hypothetical protein